jgi:hypothetical protein
LKVFTQHIYQEIKRTKYINYLNDKREKKAAAEEQHRRDTQATDKARHFSKQQTLVACGCDCTRRILL